MDRARVEALARAAHLALAAGEADALAADLAVILRRLEPLRRVDPAAAPPLAPAGDESAPAPDGGAPDALVRGPETFAPGYRAPFFVVPRLASHADAREAAGDASVSSGGTEGGR